MLTVNIVVVNYQFSPVCVGSVHLMFRLHFGSCWTAIPFGQLTLKGEACFYLLYKLWNFYANSTLG